jgi:predicted house-cleaning noncanonical NTP pyrophosphatase (MazG superfamily)
MVLSKEMEDLAVMAAVEIGCFKKREKTATFVRQLEENLLEEKYLESPDAVEALADFLTLITELKSAKARFEGIRDKILTTIETSKKTLENWASVSEALDEIGKHDN